MNDYRGYFFGNMYLSSIQHGIQAAHVIQAMYRKYCREYEPPTNAADIFTNWCFHDKTMICLNGGGEPDLAELYKMLKILAGDEYPVSLFKEDAGLNFAMTSVGIVIPKEIYDFMRICDTTDTNTLTDNQKQIAYIIKDYKLAT